MIRYALICADCEAAFDAWFRSSDSYTEQAKAGEVTCPACESARVSKQIMAPSVCTSKAASSSNDGDISPAELMKAARKYIAETHDYVGDSFPDEARAMHYGEIDERPIWGEAKPEESKALREEGVGAVPLPAPFAPKPPKDKSKLN